MSTDGKQPEARRLQKRKAKPAAQHDSALEKPSRPERLFGLRDHAASRGLRQDQVLLMQRTHGNRVVQRLLRKQSLRSSIPARNGLVRRQQAGGGSTSAGARSKEVPALSQTAVTKAKSNLASKPQAAIDAVVADLSGQIDTSFLQDQKMHYVPQAKMPAGHYGFTSLTPGSGRPRPCRVIIGQDAMRNVGILYMTIMHEWQHVLQFRSGPATGRGEAVDETEARLWEVENLAQSGLWRDGQYMRQLPGQLDHWWKKLSKSQQQPLMTRYQAALRTLKTMEQRRLDEQFRQQTGS